MTFYLFSMMSCLLMNFFKYRDCHVRTIMGLEVKVLASCLGVFGNITKVLFEPFFQFIFCLADILITTFLAINDVD